MQKLISMLDTDVIALQSAGSRESRAYIPCSDVVRTLLEEIAEMVRIKINLVYFLHDL